jgi:hypothetical protein
MDETASDEAAGSSVTAGLATGRFARRCIAIASGEIGSLANGVTCAMASGATRPPRIRLLRVTMVRLFVKKCNRVVLSLALLPDINDLRMTALIWDSWSDELRIQSRWWLKGSRYTFGL